MEIDFWGKIAMATKTNGCQNKLMNISDMLVILLFSDHCDSSHIKTYYFYFISSLFKKCVCTF